MVPEFTVGVGDAVGVCVGIWPGGGKQLNPVSRRLPAGHCARGPLFGASVMRQKNREERPKHSAAALQGPVAAEVGRQAVAPGKNGQVPIVDVTE
jgi:hypothetical protein